MYSISIKSIFARAVIKSLSVVAHSINITAVCPVGALVDILKQEEESYQKPFYWKDVVTRLFALKEFASFWCLVYMSDKITRFWIASASKQTLLQIITSAVYSISIKSIFASAVIGSLGVVIHSINTTIVCSIGALVDI